MGGARSLAGTRLFFPTMSDTPDTMQELLRQLQAQNKTNRAAINAINRTLKQLAKQTPKPAEPQEAPADDFAPQICTHEDSPEESMQRMRKNALDTFASYALLKKGRGSTFHDEVIDQAMFEVEDVSDTMFRALLLRDFPPEVEEAYRQRRMHRKVLYGMVLYCAEMVNCGFLRIYDPEWAEAADALERETPPQETAVLKPTAGAFRLPGRKKLETFFNREVVDIVNNHAAYRKLGIDFPEHFVLEGAPGCGKTYAVEALAKHLGWHVERITSSTVGSKYVHETAQHIEQRFNEAEAHAPAIIIVDEMDAFMRNRSGHIAEVQAGLVEEVASFLRCIQDAASKRILVVGMANSLEGIDPAILRTGRFGTHIKMEMPNAAEVESLLRFHLRKRPHARFPLARYAAQLVNRPLSDVTHVVRQAALHAARLHHAKLQESDLRLAVSALLRNSAPRTATVGFLA